MPRIELASHYQRAVLWPWVSKDRYGQDVVGVPVEIAVRWKTTRREMLDKQGNQIILDATAQVEQDIVVGSHMALGTLADWSGTGTFLPDSELMEVKSFAFTKDIKGRDVYREVGLLRLHNPPH